MFPVMQWIRWFNAVGIDDVGLVGGKNASLGEMLRELSSLGVPVPDGFAITTEAFQYFLKANGAAPRITNLLKDRAPNDVAALEAKSQAVRDLLRSCTLPADLQAEIVTCYHELGQRYKTAALAVAVRSSATAEDLPGASFAGAHDTILNVSGDAGVLESVRRCFASLYTSRAVKYRDDMGIVQDTVSLSVGVQNVTQRRGCLGRDVHARHGDGISRRGAH